MSSISSVSSNSAWMQTQMRTRPSAAQQTKLAEDVFSTIDTAKQGSFDLAGLTSAVKSASSSSQNTSGNSFSDSDIATAFSKLDSDGDGKVTQQEFTSTVSQLHGRHHGHGASSSAEASTSDTSAASAQGMPPMGGMGGMPPPPDGDRDARGADEGFTVDQLKAQLDAMGTADSKRATLINKVLNNFSTADTDGNGKVNFAEAMALDSNPSTDGSMSVAATATTTASTTTQQATTSSLTSAAQLQQRLMSQIMKIMETYGATASNAANDTAQLSLTA